MANARQYTKAHSHTRGKSDLRSWPHCSGTARAAISVLSAGSSRFSMANDLTAMAISTECVRACPRLGRRIARAYLAAPLIDDDARPAYNAFREETLRQLEFLTGPVSRGGLGVAVSISQCDPYRNVLQLFDELAEGRLQVWSTAACGNLHPLLSNDDNDAFRAVHDASATARPAAASMSTARRPPGSSTAACTASRPAEP